MLQKQHKDGVKILLLLFLVLLQQLLAQLSQALFVKGTKGPATPLRGDQATVNIFLVGDGIATSRQPPADPRRGHHHSGRNLNQWGSEESKEQKSP